MSLDQLRLFRVWHLIDKLGRQNEFFTDLLLGIFRKQPSLSVSLKCENAQQAPYEYYIK